MKHLTKTIALILALAVFALMAMGSGSVNSESSGSSSSGSSSSSSESASGSISNSGSSSTSGKSTTEETIEEQELFNQDGVIVTAKEYVNDAIWGEGIKLLIENNTEQNITVSCDALIVNNYMISDLFSSSVAAGKKANDTLYLLSHELDAAGIDSVGQVEIYFHVYDADSWDDLFTTDVVTIQTSEYSDMDTTPSDLGEELVNESGVKIYGRYVDEDSFWGASVLLYCENNSGQNITITCEDMSVNGFMITPYSYTTVYDGKKAFSDITLMSTELEENDIDKIEEIELKFNVTNADNWSNIFTTSAVSFSVNQ